MKDLFQLYIQQFKTTFASMFQYRASLVIWMIGQVLEPLVYLIVWSTVSNGNGGSVGNYTTGAFASYFIVLMLVNQFTYTWVMFDYEYRIREGIFSFALLKPVHPIHSDIADNIMSKAIPLPILTVIAIVLAFAFHASSCSYAVGYYFIYPGVIARFCHPVSCWNGLWHKRHSGRPASARSIRCTFSCCYFFPDKSPRCHCFLMQFRLRPKISAFLLDELVFPQNYCWASLHYQQR